MNAFTPTKTNQILFSRIKKLVAIERRISIEILECLYEIEKRKAYAELKYDGLFTYCVKELGFTDSQAYQRIQAMRALKEIPELKSKIESGALNVSSVSKVHSHFKKQRKDGIHHSKFEKLELFKLMENQTSKQVDQKLMEIRGEPIRTELKLELDEEAEKLWKQVKGLSADRTQSDSLETFKMLMREWVKKNDPSEKQAQIEKSRHTVPSSTKVKEQHSQTSKMGQASLLKIDAHPIKPQKSLQNAPTSNEAESITPSRYIPSGLRRKIWSRDHGKCANCGAQHALEIDHIRPLAKSGSSTAENLRLLCRSCNIHSAIRAFGLAATQRK